MLTFQQFNESLSNDVIGTTDGYGPSKSGKNAKNIYSTYDHLSHKDFDAIDHEAAASAHMSKMHDVRREMFPKNPEYLSKVQKTKLEQHPDYIYHKSQKELHDKKSEELSKPQNDKLKQEKLERIRKEAAFRKAIWSKIDDADKDHLIGLRDALYNLRQYHPDDTPGKYGETVRQQRKAIKDAISKIENKYYQKYSHLKDVLTSKKLADLDSKTGLFSND